MEFSKLKLPVLRLLPCPFCGGKAFVVLSGLENIDGRAVPTWQAQCECGAYGPFKKHAGDENAATLWNTRV